MTPNYTLHRISSSAIVARIIFCNLPPPPRRGISMKLMKVNQSGDWVNWPNPPPPPYPLSNMLSNFRPPFEFKKRVYQFCDKCRFFVRIRSFLLTLDTINILCQVYSDFCSNEIIFIPTRSFTDVEMIKLFYLSRHLNKVSYKSQEKLKHSNK